MPLAQIDRRALVAGLLFAPAALAATRVPVVTFLGDSITAGYGLSAPSQALPAQMQAELARSGLAVRIVAAGVPGDTTAGGLARLRKGAVPSGTDVCVVELGGNDLLNGVAPARVRANLESIVRELKARRCRVVLTGMRAPPILDPAYVAAFDGAFPSVARAQNIILYPFLLDGVAIDGRLNQHDRIHPNAAGVKVIAARLAPVLARAIRQG